MLASVFTELSRFTKHKRNTQPVHRKNMTFSNQTNDEWVSDKSRMDIIALSVRTICVVFSLTPLI